VPHIREAYVGDSDGLFRQGEGYFLTHCPQRLKPLASALKYGTAKAVPLSKTIR